MDAIVSGQAGVALLLDGKKLSSLQVGEDGIVPRRPSEVPLLLGGAGDLRLLRNIKPEQVREQLHLESSRIDVLHLALILLDLELADDTRQTAAEELDEELLKEGMAEWLEGVLFAHPLPASADLAGAYAACTKAMERTRTLLGRLEAYQSFVREVQEAWQGISGDRFGVEKGRKHAQSVFVRAGLFRSLVMRRAVGESVDSFLIESLSNPLLREVPDSRHVLLDWVAALRKPRELRAISKDDSLEEVDSYKEEERSSPRGNLESVMSQIDWRKTAIVTAMRKRELETAREEVAGLIDFQLTQGEPVHVCKSLCDLASRAKDLGLFKLQLELTTRSIKLKGDDAWSWTQHGDALLRNGQLTEALSAYDNAFLFGERLFTATGRAEVLKAQNRLGESLEAYESVIRDFPSDVVARTGRAEVLKAQSRLAEALEAYESVIRDFPENVVARTGRAEVLKAQSRLPESLEAYESVIRDFPENVVARNGCACVLAALGRSEEALGRLASGSPVTADDWVAYHIRGMVLLRMERMEEAAAIFLDGMKNCPRPAQQDYFRTAYAVSCLKQKSFMDAAEALDEVKNPQLQSTATLLRFHAFGGVGDREKALEQDRALAPVVVLARFKEIRDELARRFIRREPPRYSDEELIRAEIDLFLEAA